jgi:hypothetical protein
MIKEFFAKIDVWDFIKRNFLTVGMLIYILSVAVFSAPLISLLMYVSALICFSIVASQFVLLNYTKSKLDNDIVRAIVFLSVSLLIALGSWIKFADVL